MPDIPESWIRYIFQERRAILERMSKGEVARCEIYLSFTRAMPAIVTYGPAGINASIKMIGILPRKDMIEEVYMEVLEFMQGKHDMGSIVSFLLDRVYIEDRLDFTKLFTLDLARRNTWRNLRANDEAILLFFTPPSRSFMVKARTTIHEDDIISRFANAMHDMFHFREIERVPRAPAYVFHITEIWDKSADKFGVRIYP